MMRRGIFRRFNKHFKADKVLRELIEGGHRDYVHLREVLEWALKTETVYENKHQKGIRTKRQQKQKLLNASSNPLNSVAYKYSKKAMEFFFRDDRLRSLFLRYAQKIKDEGYIECKNRRNNRVDCKPASSEVSSPSKSGIAGHSIALPNLVSSLPELSQSVDSSDELSYEHNDQSDQSIDTDDDESSFEKEEKAPKKGRKKTTTIDLKTLSKQQLQDLFCKEVDCLIEVSEIITDFKDSVPI
jgi:hypothetical protein